VEERESDKKTLETLLGCLKNRFEVSNSIHKPALYTQTMLLSARDGEQVLQKRGADVIGGEKARKTLLLSELHQALRQFGFDVQRGSVELIDHAGAVPAVTVTLESVVSWLADRIEPLDLEAINATAFSELAKRQAEARAAETRHLHEILAEHDAAEAAAQAAAVRMFEEAEAKRQEKATKKAERKESKRRRKTDEKHADAERLEGIQAAKQAELEVKKRDQEETVQVPQEKKQRMALISIRI
jgi:hypothetical protein